MLSSSKHLSGAWFKLGRRVMYRLGLESKREVRPKCGAGSSLVGVLKFKARRGLRARLRLGASSSLGCSFSASLCSALPCGRVLTYC